MTVCISADFDSVEKVWLAALRNWDTKSKIVFKGTTASFYITQPVIPPMICLLKWDDIWNWLLVFLYHCTNRKFCLWGALFAMAFAFFYVLPTTNTVSHMLLMDCSLTLSPPPHPPLLTAWAQRQVVWPLSSMSFSLRHLPSSPLALAFHLKG